MHPADEIEVIRVLTGLATIKRVDLTPEALDLWCAALADWDLADFKAAASHLVRSCQWMPTPYDFEQLRRASEPTAGEAWDHVLSGAPLVPGSREYRAAQIVGGQWGIRHANIEKDIPFIAKRFREAYDELTDADVVRHALPQLVGLPALGDSLKRISR